VLGYSFVIRCSALNVGGSMLWLRRKPHGPNVSRAIHSAAHLRFAEFLGFSAFIDLSLVRDNENIALFVALKRQRSRRHAQRLNFSMEDKKVVVRRGNEREENPKRHEPVCSHARIPKPKCGAL
jgi:hypothetical protein